MSREQLDTRTRILDAALNLLESGQGGGVRMADIARRAGVSRQAVYLHFATRAELLIAATQYLDVLNGSDQRLAESRSAPSGIERLEAYIAAWGNYIPEIYGVAKALLAMRDTDEAAATAWNDRMQAMRHGCAAAITALKRDGDLSAGHSTDEATDLLWTMLSVRNWEHLTIDCNWSQEHYLEALQAIARRVFVSSSN